MADGIFQLEERPGEIGLGFPVFWAGRGQTPVALESFTKRLYRKSSCSDRRPG